MVAKRRVGMGSVVNEYELFSLVLISVLILINISVKPALGNPSSFVKDPRQPVNNLPYSDRNLHTDGPSRLPSPTKLSDNPDCKEDIIRLCGNSIRYNNFAILDCLQDDKRSEEDGLSERCSHLLWNYKKNLTEDGRFLDAARQVCNNEKSKFESCQSPEKREQAGHFLSCLIDQKDNMTSPPCKQFLTKMESIIFADFRLIYKFVDKCRDDIESFKCGRINENKGEVNDKPHSQGETIECLQKVASNLKEECQHEILRISELQSDDFQLDRPLYFACREDREFFCKKISSGDGRVYKCLLHHKNDREMSTQCREKLIQRQKLIAQDYKVSKGLARACRDDIKQYKCRDETSKNRELRLAQILICLENAVHLDKPVSLDCQTEMMEHRKSLMEDYQISPDLVNACQTDIQRVCNDKLEGDGKTIHCLMEHAKPTTRKKKRISEQCMRELEKLLRETDPAEDWRVDPALKESCQSVVDAACKDIKAGEARVLSCLMEKIGSDHMNDECEEKLLQIQYFVSRDFRLDSRLFKACRENAVVLCKASQNWADDTDKMGPERGPLLPCLFRYAYHPNQNLKLSVGCLQEVRRVMRQRAISVELHPEIMEPCMTDLSEHCLDRVAKGTEIVCLQDNLETLSTPCRDAISNFTEEEAEHAELNAVVYQACESSAKKYCEEIVKKDVDEGELMQCLIKHKNELEMKWNHKCKTAVEHFQLISLKDYRFSFKFKESCKSIVMEKCKSIRTKAEVVHCLSEMVRNDTLFERPPRVSKECRQQLRVELLQRNEDINLDPELNQVCKEDREKFCKNVSPGNSMVLECLKNNRRSLSPLCHRKVFSREKDEMLDNSVDFTLTTVCKRMIKRFCVETDSADVLNCLKDYKDDIEFDPKCRSIVLRRMVQQNSDYRLNPHLKKACQYDLPKFCADIIVEAEKHDRTLEGKVVECLKDKFRIHQLSNECGLQVARIIKEAQLDYRQDPVLVEVCKQEIEQLCNMAKETDGKGQVEECLKVKFQKNEIKHSQCKIQIAKLLQQGRADIHVDPLLYKACALDLRQYCSSIPAGEGRQLSCLLEILHSNSAQLHRECKTVLSRREEMFQYAARVAPVDNVQALIEQVSHSPARNYFIVVTFAVFGMIFFGGLFCGRVTKRVRTEIKNK